MLSDGLQGNVLAILLVDIVEHRFDGSVDLAFAVIIQKRTEPIQYVLERFHACLIAAASFNGLESLVFKRMQLACVVTQILQPMKDVVT